MTPDAIVHDALTFVDLLRIGISLVFTVVVIRIVIVMSSSAQVLRQLLQQAHEDHQARENTVQDLRRTAHDLATKVDELRKQNGD